MTRLIDADELKGHIATHRSVMCPVAGVLKDIDRLPTVDAVKVIRCKDCQYSHEPSILVKGFVECEKSCSGECLKREDWYCPLGERRGDSM